MNHRKLSLIGHSLLILSLLPFAASALDTEAPAIRYEVVADGLFHPWSVAFLPDGRSLVSERSGQLRVIDARGALLDAPVAGLPVIRQHGQGGLLDVMPHPQFAENHWIYLSYAEPGRGGYGTAVGRGRLEGMELKEFEVLFRLLPKTGTPYHFGSRLVFDRENHLFITLGDRGEMDRAQDLADHAGSLIRLHDDGRVPSDNPFVNTPGARPEIYSYGHRNMQGATLNPFTGEVWTHEHGPQGGDEINIPRAGVNYGWPVITYGVNYGSGTPIGEGTSKSGMAQPLYYWVPSIAPSGMAFYDADRFPEWRGNLFVGSLKFRQLVRLEIEDGRIVHEQRLFKDVFGRIRDVRQGPDGYLYLLTDADDGKLIRLLPE